MKLSDIMNDVEKHARIRIKRIIEDSVMSKSV